MHPPLSSSSSSELDFLCFSVSFVLVIFWARLIVVYIRSTCIHSEIGIALLICSRVQCINVAVAVAAKETTTKTKIIDAEWKCMHSDCVELDRPVECHRVDVLYLSAWRFCCEFKFGGGGWLERKGDCDWFCCFRSDRYFTMTNSGHGDWFEWSDDWRCKWVVWCPIGYICTIITQSHLAGGH